MSEIPFYKTRMGQRFFEQTMPEIATQLRRLCDLLEGRMETEAVPPPAARDSDDGGSD